METVIDFIFLGSKITADNDCSHEIKMLYTGESCNSKTVSAELFPNLLMTVCGDDAEMPQKEKIITSPQI